jgi:hypothetical protein
MIYLNGLIKINDTKFSIGMVHYMPFDEVDGLHKTKEELEVEGILINEIPQPNAVEGKSANMFWNPVDKCVFYEYADIPKTENQLLTEKINLMQKAIDDMIMGGV